MKTKRKIETQEAKVRAKQADTMAGGLGRTPKGLCDHLGAHGSVLRAGEANFDDSPDRCHGGTISPSESSTSDDQQAQQGGQGQRGMEESQ